jgi:hypothetical protein
VPGPLSTLTATELDTLQRAFEKIAAQIGNGEFVVVASRGKVCDLRAGPRVHVEPGENVGTAIGRLFGDR